MDEERDPSRGAADSATASAAASSRSGSAPSARDEARLGRQAVAGASEVVADRAVEDRERCLELPAHATLHRPHRAVARHARV